MNFAPILVLLNPQLNIHRNHKQYQSTFALLDLKVIVLHPLPSISIENIFPSSWPCQVSRAANAPKRAPQEYLPGALQQHNECAPMCRKTYSRVVDFPRTCRKHAIRSCHACWLWTLPELVRRVRWSAINPSPFNAWRECLGTREHDMFILGGQRHILSYVLQQDADTQPKDDTHLARGGFAPSSRKAEEGRARKLQWPTLFNYYIVVLRRRKT